MKTVLNHEAACKLKKYVDTQQKVAHSVTASLIVVIYLQVTVFLYKYRYLLS